MENKLMIRRLVQVGALILIGDGVIGLVKPRWQSLLWRFGPQLAKAANEELADHPTTARALYLAEALAGFALASLPVPDEEG